MPDYDQAISYCCGVLGFESCGVLGFELIEDALLGAGRRWVTVRPRRAGSSALLLARARSPEQRERIGDQAGGRVFLFLQTDDFAGDYARYVAAGVHFVEQPRTKPYGTVAVFEDAFGNPGT